MNKEIKSRRLMNLLVLLSCCGGLAACQSVPKQSLKPVSNFQIEKYLGEWYEIARYDFKWENNIKDVKAKYTLNKDGSIKVLNSGYDIDTGNYKESVGKAKFVKDKNVGALKVSFFGPFYSSYTVISVDENYQYALVAGENKKLLWILSRTPTIPDEVKQNYIRLAEAAGYNMFDLVWTFQEQPGV